VPFFLHNHLHRWLLDNLQIVLHRHLHGVLHNTLQIQLQTHLHELLHEYLRGVVAPAERPIPQSITGRSAGATRKT
jgi:hypothetical protein